MNAEDPINLDSIDQEIRINELKEQVREAVGGKMHEWISKDCPPEVQEQFWRNVAAYEKAVKTTNFDQLIEAGLKLPAPDQLNDR